MCFICDSGLTTQNSLCLGVMEDYETEFNESVLRKADKDVSVFKIVKTNGSDTDSAKSFFYDKVYKIGKTYTSKIKGIGITINKGLHSYETENVGFIKDNEIVYLKTKIFNGKVIFSIPLYKDSVTDYLLDNMLIMHCIVPKGARYITNSKGKVVSNKLKVLSFSRIDISTIREMCK